jgi:hypothetical protein
MQAKYTVALALGAGFALGAGAIHGLHAASAPPAYVIGEIAVKDEAGYKNDFLPAAQKAIDDNGGKYIAGGFNIEPFPPALPICVRPPDVLKDRPSARSVRAVQIKSSHTKLFMVVRMMTACSNSSPPMRTPSPSD